MKKTSLIYHFYYCLVKEEGKVEHITHFKTSEIARRKLFSDQRHGSNACNRIESAKNVHGSGSGSKLGSGLSLTHKCVCMCCFPAVH